MKTKFNYPPLWTLATIAAVLSFARLFPGMAQKGWATVPLTVLFVIGGVALTLAAAIEMYKFRTTIIPHRTPSAIVTSGIFRWSRNPIYLGDLFFVVAACVWSGFLLGLVYVLILKMILERRFVLVEEEQLRSNFPEQFERWTQSTRRWI